MALVILFFSLSTPSFASLDRCSAGTEFLFLGGDSSLLGMVQNQLKDDPAVHEKFLELSQRISALGLGIRWMARKEHTTFGEDLGAFDHELATQRTSIKPMVSLSFSKIMNEKNREVIEALAILERNVHFFGVVAALVGSKMNREEKKITMMRAAGEAIHAEMLVYEQFIQSGAYHQKWFSLTDSELYSHYKLHQNGEKLEQKMLLKAINLEDDALVPTIVSSIERLVEQLD